MDVARGKRIAVTIKRERGVIEGKSPIRCAGSAAYAALCADALKRGWSIDSHIVQADFADIKAVVIPSPGRREIPGLAEAWVMKQVPVRK